MLCLDEVANSKTAVEANAGEAAFAHLVNQKKSQLHYIVN